MGVPLASTRLCLVLALPSSSRIFQKNVLLSQLPRSSLSGARSSIADLGIGGPIKVVFPPAPQFDFFSGRGVVGR